VSSEPRVSGSNPIGEFFFRNASFAKIPNVLGIFDFSGKAGRALTFLTASSFSGCCFRLNSIFFRELSRSLVDKWLLVTTPIASDPPNPTPNYPTAGLTAGPESDLSVNVQKENRSSD
jgi:hypothetical protein